MPATASATYKPSTTEKYMSAKQLDYFRKRLLAWRDELSKNHAKPSTICAKRTGMSPISPTVHRWRPKPVWNCAPAIVTSS